MNSSKSSPLLHKKRWGQGENLIAVAQAEGPCLTGQCYVSCLVSLLSSSLPQRMNSVLRCGGSVQHVGGTLEQLARKRPPGTGAGWAARGWSCVSCSCPFQQLNSWFMLTLASGGGGESLSGSLIAQGVCCLWRAWTCCPCSPVTSAIKCSQENPSPSQSKVCSQTFWGGEGLAEDLLPLILK